MVEDFRYRKRLFSPLMCTVQHSLNLLQPRLHGSRACRVPGASSGRTCDDHFEESKTSLASKSCGDPLRPCPQITIESAGIREWMFPLKLIGCYLQQQNADLAPAPVETGSRYAGALGYFSHCERSRIFFRQ